MMREKTIEELMGAVERSAGLMGIEAPQDDDTQTPEDRAGMEEAVERARELAHGGAPPTAGDDAPAPAPSTEAPAIGGSPSPAKPPPPDAAAAPRTVAPRMTPGPEPRNGAPDWDGLLQRSRNGMLLDNVINAGNRSLSRYSAQPPATKLGEQLAGMPLEAAKERQGFEARQLAGDAQRAKLGADVASRDPLSPQSQKARETWKAMGLPMPPGFEEWSAADVKAANAGDFTRIAQLKNAAEERKAREAQRLKEKTEANERHDKERGEDVENRKLNHADAQANAAATRALAVAAQSRLPAGEAVALGGADAAVNAVEDLSGDWDRLASEMGSGVKQFLPGTDANLYLPNLNTSTQVVGKYLEGGKLTDADVPKYRAMMPQPSDTAAQKAAKITALRRLIENKRAEEAKALQGAGYRVPKSDAEPPRISPAKPPPGVIPPGAKNVKPFGNGWAYTLPDGSEELWEP